MEFTHHRPEFFEFVGTLFFAKNLDHRREGRLHHGGFTGGVTVLQRLFNLIQRQVDDLADSATQNVKGGDFHLVIAVHLGCLRLAGSSCSGHPT